MFFGPQSFGTTSVFDGIRYRTPSAGTESPALNVMRVAFTNTQTQTTNMNESLDKPRLLGIASRIYVVSLPRRTDRRVAMERLRQTLDVNWTYVDAVHSDDTAVGNIIEHVRNLREELEASSVTGSADDIEHVLISEDAEETWPSQELHWLSDPELESLVLSNSPPGTSESDDWSLPVPDAENESLPDTGSPYYDLSGDDPSIYTEPPDDENIRSSENTRHPLTCAIRNYVTGRSWVPSTPAYMILSPAKVACWFSHLQVLRLIADDTASPATWNNTDNQSKETQNDDVTIILEDDIDMERDIEERLKTVWSALPPQWDIVFLGHCWSNESTYPALPVPDINAGRRAGDPIQTALHPSFAPKCTHAYALSRTGARRLLLHLRHPQFAYSRAYDQALAWLVLSGRLKAFSLVPSVAVQRKVDGSDIDAGRSGLGSPWRESLMNGVFGS
ncbi:hypothetical protein CERSUDRAFT_90028 [Gelatoporia subvermispora B]|uniref:Glycosyltransferase family 25 protein n=1 Tax=Ceriporiopsis subvermispora (strain B) TaxID=914234 RepID=M2RSQ1_CERS8|nr:hypothetical protein CERSUDRAFT_90028 [Gelatoporia subvermispora B]